MTLLASRRLRVEPFSDRHLPAVRAFNGRLAAGGADWRLPEEPAPEWLRRVEDGELYQELLVFLEGDEVRGGYVLVHQPVALGGEIRQAGKVSLPLSEGTVNQAYSLVGSRIFSDAMGREPLLFALGMHGGATPVGAMVRALRWPTWPVPFFFKVVNANRFLRQIRYLRTSRLRSRLLDMAAFSGLGWAVAATAGRLLTRRPRGIAGAQAEEVSHFGEWADSLWQSCAGSYSFASVRTAEILNRIYPANRSGLLRLKVTRRGRVIGYAVLQDQQSLASRKVGEMRVGTVVDVLARPEDAEVVIWLAARMLERRRVDLLISNQSHPAWSSALRRSGFIRGPMHCRFAAGRQLADSIRARDPEGRELHVTRGDGDCHS